MPRPLSAFSIGITVSAGTVPPAVVDGRCCWPVAEEYPLAMITSTLSDLLNAAPEMPDDSPLCQNPPSPMIETVRLPMAGATPAVDDRPSP